MRYRLNVKKIVELRLKLGWSQRKLAREAGISEGMGPHIEKQGQTSERTLKKIADALGKEPGELLSNPDQTRIDSAVISLLNGPLAYSLEKSSIPIAIYDMERNVRFVTQGWLKLWGYSHKSEVLGQRCSHLYQDRVWVGNAIKSLANGEFWVGEVMGRTLRGETIKIIVSAELLHEENKNPSLIICTYVRPFYMRHYGDQPLKSLDMLENDEII